MIARIQNEIDVTLGKGIDEGRQLARYTLIALLVSVLLGVFIATAIEYLDVSIK